MTTRCFLRAHVITRSLRRLMNSSSSAPSRLSPSIRCYFSSLSCGWPGRKGAEGLSSLSKQPLISFDQGTGPCLLCSFVINPKETIFLFLDLSGAPLRPSLRSPRCPRIQRRQIDCCRRRLPVVWLATPNIAENPFAPPPFASGGSSFSSAMVS